MPATESTAARKFRFVGTRPIRHDGADKVTGRANYGADFTLPGMLWGKVLRSPHAHARIINIDCTRALAMPGVMAAATAADLPDVPPGKGPIDNADLSRNILAREKALYHGHAVAAVAAASAEQAEAALAQIDVQYEVLQPVLSIEAAIQPGAPELGTARTRRNVQKGAPANIDKRVVFERGSLQTGFAEADAVLEREFQTEMVHQGYIEPHACIAAAKADGQIDIWCSTQGGFPVRNMCANVLAVETAKIKVTPTEIGGGFGGKTTVYLEPVAAVLSRKSGRPVKMVMTREEVFRATGPASGSRSTIKIGARSDGRITAAQAEFYLESGGFPGAPVTASAMAVFAPYNIPHLHICGYDVVLNKPKVAAYRAPGAPQVAFAVESLLDELAQALDLCPVELRLTNAVKEGDQLPYGPRFKAIGMRETLQAARAHPHFKAPLGKNQGRGVAVGFWFNGGMQSSANVHLAEDGGAIVVTGNPDIGGSRASMAIMCAEELGIDVHKVRPLVADTEAAGYTDVTGGSRTTFATGWAVIEASRQIKTELCKRAALLWECEPEQVTFTEGQCVPAEGSGLSHDALTVAQLAKQMAKTGGPINGQCQMVARGAGPGFATHVCDVEVDPHTGKVDVLRYTAVQDAGRAIHPAYVEGQMQGGVAQGIGWALNEEMLFTEDGALDNPGFLDYRVPVASDLPMIETVIVEVPNPAHPYGVRGVGETPIVPPLAAVANAVQRAAKVRMRALPISPPRLLAAMQKGGGA